MIKKLASKLSSFLLKFKKKKTASAQDVMINSVIEKITEDIAEVAEVADKALSKVAETAVAEAKVVADTIEAKAPKKPAAKKAAATGATPKPKGRPKKSA